ncbi:MAG: hypothetical protein ACREA3_03575 [Nitrosotalea sp.]
MIFTFDAIASQTSMTWGELWWANGNYLLYGIGAITAAVVFFVLRRK